MMKILGSIEMENGAVIQFELYPNEARKTFHRVIPHFVSQGGCPNGDGTGDLGYTIPCETKGNPHRHESGSLSMAHRGKDTGCCQFFICHDPQPHLDGVHTVFGKVIDGLDEVRRMKNGDVMTSVTIEEA